MDKKVLGMRIREQRRALKLTQEKFAEKIQIGSEFLGLVERGERLPSLNTFCKIVDACGVSADVLLKDHIAAATPYVLNDITIGMQGLKPEQLKMAADVLAAMTRNFQAQNEREEKEEIANG